MDANHIKKKVYDYCQNYAPILLLVLSQDGRIAQANQFAKRITSRPLVGDNIKDLIVDFSGEFRLPEIVRYQDREHLFNIETVTGLPETFYFTFMALSDQILVLGRMDSVEIENTRKDFLSLNQQLNNKTRELYKKNAQLKELNQALEVANQKITELTRIDPLTQIANRRYFKERINEMVSMAKRYSQPLSIIMSDIDHFKRVNDTHGHDAGDQVLLAFAKLMKDNTRSEDIAARYGGEEFIIALALTDAQTATGIAERIRKSFLTMDVLNNGESYTASFGVSQMKKDEKIEEVIKRADAALYSSKDSGRNRTSLAN